MGWRVDYKNFNFDEYELTESGYNSIISSLKSGQSVLGKVIPKISFYESEKTRINRVLVISSVAVIILLYGVLVGDINSVFPLFYMTMMVAGALGGFGVLFSFISYSAYTSKRESYLFKMKRDLLKSSSYDEYCKIRKLN